MLHQPLCLKNTELSATFAARPAGVPNAREREMEGSVSIARGPETVRNARVPVGAKWKEPSSLVVVFGRTMKQFPFRIRPELVQGIGSHAPQEADADAT